MSSLALPLSQPREVSRRRLSLRRVVVNPQAGEPQRRDTNAAGQSAIQTVKSAVARLEALVRDNRPAAEQRDPVPLDTLMGGATTLPILHNGEVYTLRKTRYGKLILTK